MAIWIYRKAEPYRLLESEAVVLHENYWDAMSTVSKEISCRYCKIQMQNIAFEKEESKEKRLFICSVCGWWVVATWSGNTYGPEGFMYIHRAAGILKNLDMNDINTPKELLKNNLLKKYDERFNIDPRKFEEIVGGVFSDFGYHVRVTSFSRDKGIDVVILDGDSDKVVGKDGKGKLKRNKSDRWREH